MPGPHRFPGIKAYVRADHVRPDFAAKVASEWFVSRAVDALTQHPAVPPESRADCLSQAADALAALRCCVAAVEAALADARAAFPEGPGPKPIEEATPERSVKRRP